uniref:Putative tail protein n=1 Tax=viral metagenome TaxID=1070528 RepID=A0A6M3MF03_9ZZZZ
MKAGVKVTGVKELIQNLERLGGNVQNASVEALWTAGAHLEGALKEKLSQPGTGRTYKTGRKGARYATHQASAPGEPPAVDTGRLRSSVTHNVTGRPGRDLPDPGGSKTEAKGYVGTNLEIGPYLEFGTSRMKERPWLYPTITEEATAVAKLVQNVIKRAIAKAKRR